MGKAKKKQTKEQGQRSRRTPDVEESANSVGEGDSPEFGFLPNEVLSEGVFDSTVRTKGGLVKQGGCVLDYLSRCYKHHANVNCRVESFGRVISNFKERERRWVNEMGFGGLLWIKGRGLPRNLCYWLMTIFDPYRKVLKMPGGIDYRIHKSQVRWVFGLPHGPKAVPEVVRGQQMRDVIVEFERKFGDWVTLRNKRHRVVEIGKVRDRLENEWGETEEKEFKVAFMIVVLGDLLCPTTSSRLSKNLYAAVAVAMSSSGYDWCQLVVDKLVGSGKHFVHRFYEDGFCKGAGGCTYFLAILYLDHLYRTPIEWGEYPRVRVWTAKRVNEARLEDKHGKNGDYGKLGCMSVPYGSKHPFVPEDTMGPEGGGSTSMAYEVARIVLSGMGIDGVAAGVGAGHAAYESSEEEGLPLKRRKSGRVDKKYFSKLRVDLQALISEEDMSSGEDDVDWEADEDGVSELESLVDSDEVWFSEDDVDDDWVPGVDKRGSSVDESVTESDVEEDDDGSHRGDSEVDNQTDVDCRAGGADDLRCNEGGFSREEEEVRSEGEGVLSPGPVVELNNGSCPVMQEEPVVEGQSGGQSMEQIVISDEGVPFEELLENDETMNEKGLGELVNRILDDAFQLNNLDCSGGGGGESVEKEDFVIAPEVGPPSPPQQKQCALDAEAVEAKSFQKDAPEVGAEAGPSTQPAEEQVSVDAGGVEAELGGAATVAEKVVVAEEGDVSPPAVVVSVECGGVDDKKSKGVKSRTRRGKKISRRLKDKDFETVLIPRQHRHMRTRIVRFLEVSGRRQNFRVLLRCDSQEASVLNCRSMLCEDGGVDDNYVRTVCRLYTLSWREKYKGGSIRVMVDPTVAIRLLRETSEDTDDWISSRRVAKSAAKEYVGVSANRFFVVFVPVLQKGHWWCVGFCLNSQQIWVLDSMARAPLVEHEAFIKKLCFLVDTFFWTCDKSWVAGNVVKWERKAIKVAHQEDGFSCGVYMLGAVDKCADRFIDEFDFDKPIEEEREWLLTTHLMSDFNEAKEEMKDIIDKTVWSPELCSDTDV